MKILVVNGPNINMLGIREPELYGNKTYDDLRAYIMDHAREKGIAVEIFQSNCEGEIITKIQQAHGKKDGIIINPAAYTHTSIGILDALKSVGLPTVEVHLTDISRREEFRNVSYVSLVAKQIILGKGFEVYIEAMDFLINNR